MIVTVRHIQETVAEHFEVPLSVMTARGRTKNMDPAPRHIAMFFARHVTGKSYPTIARLFQRKDHTTVIYATRKVERLCAENDAFADEIRQLSITIGSGSTTHPQNTQQPHTFSSSFAFLEAA